THQSFADRGLYQTHQEQSPQMHSKRRVLPGRIENALANSARARVVEPCIVRSFLKFTAVDARSVR
ncbi:MAG TPA: hypothetical protein VGU64_03660, partial [Terriglobales bacterium]|nr:hypothetical protein [Terriglobales bacterium]